MELRRLKKQNMERERRARITDKISQLHDLARMLVGMRSMGKSGIRTEKVEMLAFCHEVLHNLANLMNESPEVKARLCSFCKRNLTTINPNTYEGFLSGLPSTFRDSGIQDPASASSYCQENRNRRISQTEIQLPPKKRQKLWRPYL